MWFTYLYSSTVSSGSRTRVPRVTVITVWLIVRLSNVTTPSGVQKGSPYSLMTPNAVQDVWKVWTLILHLVLDQRYETHLMYTRHCLEMVAIQHIWFSFVIKTQIMLVWYRKYYQLNTVHLHPNTFFDFKSHCLITRLCYTYVGSTNALLHISTKVLFI